MIHGWLPAQLRLRDVPMQAVIRGGLQGAVSGLLIIDAVRSLFAGDGYGVILRLTVAYLILPSGPPRP